jgi:hypothetical protein
MSAAQAFLRFSPVQLPTGRAPQGSASGGRLSRMITFVVRPVGTGGPVCGHLIGCRSWQNATVVGGRDFEWISRLLGKRGGWASRSRSPKKIRKRWDHSFPSARSSPWLSRRDWTSWDRPAVRSGF